MAGANPVQQAGDLAGSWVAPRVGAYRWYVLFILMLVYAFNYVDRQIITILAVHIKADLGISDAQFGLLFGTAFAVFYGLFGIPMARLADGWSRVKTLSISLTFWSMMTAFSGFASTFAQLGAARVGVGVGEAGATPAGVSLLGDYFERRIRATILSIYSVGVYLGAGAALMIGGPVVVAWTQAYGDRAVAPLGLAGWQAAFLTAGIPGIILAIVVLLTIREPQRGVLEGRSEPDLPNPLGIALRELGTMFPPWSITGFARNGDRGGLSRNLVLLGVAIAMGVAASWLTDAALPAAKRPAIGVIGGFAFTTNHVQWLAMGLAFYALASWFQHAARKDPHAGSFITGAPTFRMVTLAGAALAFAMNAVNGFVFVYASRYHGLGPEIGLKFGAIALVVGAGGILASGLLSDMARKRRQSGRLLFAAVTNLCLTAILVLQFTTPSEGVFTLCYALSMFFMPMWFAPLQATTQDLVPPRLRGLAFAVFSIGPNVLGLGLGPYMAGFVSDATGDLRLALLMAVAVGVLASLGLVLAARTLAADEERTVSFIKGEKIDETA